MHACVHTCMCASPNKNVDVIAGQARWDGAAKRPNESHVDDTHQKYLSIVIVIIVTAREHTHIRLTEDIRLRAS
jgi:hypothetical protein